MRLREPIRRHDLRQNSSRNKRRRTVRENATGLMLNKAAVMIRQTEQLKQQQKSPIEAIQKTSRKRLFAHDEGKVLLMGGLLSFVRSQMPQVW